MSRFISTKPSTSLTATTNEVTVSYDGLANGWVMDIDPEIVWLDCIGFIRFCRKHDITPDKDATYTLHYNYKGDVSDVVENLPEVIFEPSADDRLKAWEEEDKARREQHRSEYRARKAPDNRNHRLDGGTTRIKFRR